MPKNRIRGAQSAENSLGEPVERAEFDFESGDGFWEAFPLDDEDEPLPEQGDFWFEQD